MNLRLGLNTFCLISSQRKKSQGEKSDDLASHATSLQYEIVLSSKRVFNHSNAGKMYVRKRHLVETKHWD